MELQREYGIDDNVLKKGSFNITMGGLLSFLADIYTRIYLLASRVLTVMSFRVHGIRYGSFVSIGLPLLDVDPEGICALGDGFKMVNNARYATLGKSNRCKIVVYRGGKLIVGDNVGISNTTIVATCSITIGNNILMGGGVTIIDSDFHSLNPRHWHSDLDLVYMKKAPVLIKNNVFIGMNSTILKGVTIGDNVIIGAGSVVFKDIPDNQVWAGNPAVFIKKNDVPSRDQWM